MPSRSSFDSTPPVGFEGELKRMTLVLSVMSFARSSAENAKPRSSSRWSGTGVAPTKVTHDS